MESISLERCPLLDEEDEKASEKDNDTDSSEENSIDDSLEGSNTEGCPMPDVG